MSSRASLIRYVGPTTFTTIGSYWDAGYNGPELYVNPTRGPMKGCYGWRPLRRTAPERIAWAAADRPFGYFRVSLDGKLSKGKKPARGARA